MRQDGFVYWFTLHFDEDSSLDCLESVCLCDILWSKLRCSATQRYSCDDTARVRWETPFFDLLVFGEYNKGIKWIEYKNSQKRNRRKNDKEEKINELSLFEIVYRFQTSHFSWQWSRVNLSHCCRKTKDRAACVSTWERKEEAKIVKR